MVPGVPTESPIRLRVMSIARDAKPTDTARFHCDLEIERGTTDDERARAMSALRGMGFAVRSLSHVAQHGGGLVAVVHLPVG